MPMLQKKPLKDQSLMVPKWVEALDLESLKTYMERHNVTVDRCNMELFIAGPADYPVVRLSCGIEGWFVTLPTGDKRPVSDVDVVVFVSEVISVSDALEVEPPPSADASADVDADAGTREDG